MKANAEGLEQGVSPHVNVTPLIDVLLVLLIIFMAITPLKPGRFKALVPEPPSPDDLIADPDPLTLVVSVGRDLTLRLNNAEEVGTTNDTAKLGEALARVFRGRVEAGAYSFEKAARADLPDAERIKKTVFVKAPRAVSYGEVVKVIDAIKGAGADPVGLQIDALD